MPEGHLLHHYARMHRRHLLGRPVQASSPQGRFARGAADIDGRVLDDVEAYGKHLFHRFDDATLHVHLGRQGTLLWLSSPPPEPRPSVRLRMRAEAGAADLIAPLVCELGDGTLRARVVEGLGQDPLREDADPELAWARIHGSGRPIGAALLDQSGIAGIGNVLRAELLNMAGIHPSLEASGLPRRAFDDLWLTTRNVMRAAADEGRINAASAPVPSRSEGRASRRGKGAFGEVGRVETCTFHGVPGRRPAVIDHERRKRAMNSTAASLPSEETFSHEALFYAGADEFVDRSAPFIREGLEADESVLVVVNTDKIELLRSELGAAADEVRFADMAEIGQNPARIIPAWRDFVDEGAGSPRRRRGIGEPIWASRSEAELAECERHEALLNLAFAGEPGWRLACPYDTRALGPSVIEEAMRNHPVVVQGGVPRRSATFLGVDAIREPFDRPMAEPRGTPVELAFREEMLPAVRAFVAGVAAESGLGPTRTEDLVLAANEIATNSVRHGGGGGVLRLWDEAEALICEIRDAGLIDRPLAGRERPVPGQTSGFGLWLANQLCDLVQVRSSAIGTVVRLYMTR